MKRELAVTFGALLGLLAIRRLMSERLFVDKCRPSPSAHTYVLETSLLVPAPLHEVFPFFEDPHNLGDITPPRIRFEIVRADELPMQSGTRIEYRIRPFGVPQNWSTEIAEYEPNEGFVDLQTSGPYRYWRHRHSFAEEEGQTLMRDRVEYQMPLGLLGRLAHGLFVARQLRNVFDYRTKVIAEKFGHSNPTT